MPIYDYCCKDCSTKYDVLHLGKEIQEDIQCPKCGSRSHIKLISVSSIMTKSSSVPCCSQGTCGMERPGCSEICGME